MRAQTNTRLFVMALAGGGVGVASAGPVADSGPLPGPVRETEVRPADAPHRSGLGDFGASDASMGLVAFNANSGIIGSYVPGAASVTQGLEASLGVAPNDTEIFGEWTEIPGGNPDSPSTLRARWFTGDGSVLLPNGAELGGTPVTNLGWNFGVQNPLEFADFIQETELLEVTFEGIDRGTDLDSPNDDQLLFSQSVTFLFDGPDSSWTLGGGVVDGGTFDLIVAGGLAFDEIRLNYRFTSVVPAPAGSVAILGFGAVASGRRRR